MGHHSRAAPASILALTLLLLSSVGWQNAAHAQPGPIDLPFNRALAWQSLGPPSAGRITAVEGDPETHGVFYAAARGAGLWKTTDFGATWTMVFDAPPVGHVTAVAMAPSNTDVIYAGISDGTGGTLHRSDDAGATWAAISASNIVESIVVHESDPDRLFVAVRHEGQPGDSGGISGSTDGGRTFTLLARTSSSVTGTTVFVDGALLLVAGSAIAGGIPGLLRSTDSGSTWQPAGMGAPSFGTDTHLDIARAADGTLLALVAADDSASLLASRDAGDSWTVANSALPPVVRAEASPSMAVAADGRVLITAGTLFESFDGGSTFAPAPWAPGEGQNTFVWAHPAMAGVLMVGGDTGATVTVNGGASWSRPDTQPAAAIDHVRVDDGFPYRVCATGARDVACTSAWAEYASPGWHPLPREITGPVVSDPLEPGLVFAGSFVRYDRRTDQIIDIRPDATTGIGDRQASAMVFSTDGRTLYAGSGAVFRTVNGGLAWEAISPDLTRHADRSTQATISALTVSAVDARTLWAGLDDGRVFVTRDAGTSWNATGRPTSDPLLPVRVIEPSHFDGNSAYLVLSPGDDTTRPGQLLRTRDGGATWVDVAVNMNAPGHVHTLREDPFRRGLLFAGTDRSVFVSFDDGERWQPLQLNLPAVPVRDLVIKDATLIAGTSGRGVWALEDFSPLRQITSDVAAANLFLFRPPSAWRVRAAGGVIVDAASTVAPRPGATLSYLLGPHPVEDVTVEVIETTTGDVIRRFTSEPPRAAGGGPPQLSIEPGLHRINWDLRYTPPVPNDPIPGTLVLPGTYQVRLTVDGRSVRQAITIRMDPRVRTSMLDLTAQRDLGRALDATRAGVHSALVRDATAARSAGLTGGGGAQQQLAELAAHLAELAGMLQRADVRPTERLEATIETALDRAAALLSPGS